MTTYYQSRSRGRAAVLAAALALAALAPPSSARAQEAKNPYAGARVGDWAKYTEELKLTTVADAGNPLVAKFDALVKVTKRDDKTVTLERASTGEDGKTTKTTETIDLKEEYGLRQVLGYSAEQLKLIEIVTGDTGKATVKVGTTELATEWTNYVVKNARNPALKKTFKLWRSDRVPLSGFVRRESASADALGTSAYTIVLVEYGFGEKAPAPAKPKGEADPKAPEDGANTIGMKFKLLPAGEVVTGTLPKEAFVKKYRALALPEDKLALLTDTPPQETVAITHPFYLGVHEVTIGQFKQFVADAKYRTGAERDKKGGTGRGRDGTFVQNPQFTWENYGFPVTDEHPVANVTREDAVAFCEWLSKKEGRKYRLPTEAEWEYACRGGAGTAFAHGDDVRDLVRYGNVADAALRKQMPVGRALKESDWYEYLAPVGTFEPNRFGLYDTHGNVCEWCAGEFDFFAPAPDLTPEGWKTIKLYPF